MKRLDPNNKYIVACSYGPDSMALLDMCIKKRLNIIVCHVNYHLRVESNVEETELRKFCNAKNIPFYFKDVTQTLTSNIEEKCREIRYDFFDEIFHKFSCDGLLVAHQQDDLIETYLLQKKRKNLPLFYGIKYKSVIKNMNVYRPLISQSKKSLMKYCLDNGIPYSIDKTNFQNIYQRNKIRHEVVECLTKENRANLIRTINEENVNLKRCLKKVNKFKTINKEIFELFDDVELAYFLNLQARKVFPSAEISLRKCLEIKKEIFSKKPNIEIKINNNFYFCKNYENYTFLRKQCNFGFSFEINEPIILDNQFFYFNMLSDSTNRNVYPDSYPVTIRNLKPHDKVRIKDYFVEARRLFIDWKMPTDLRKRWPAIINNKNEIIYVPRYQSNFVKEPNSNFYVK